MFVVTAMVAGAVAYFVTRGPGYPDVWDPRLAELVEFVEREQRAPFEHPVHVEFRGDDEFEADLEYDEEELTEDDREEIAQSEAFLRAFGFASGDVGLFDAMNTVNSQGTLAYYEPHDKRIVIKGDELTPDIRVVVVHELTHAWQDQHDDLSRLDDLESEEARTALRAVVEGEATIVEDAYASTLDEDEADAYEEGMDDGYEEYEDATTDVPPVILAEKGAPYELGNTFLAYIEEVDGFRGRREAVANPPTSLEQLMDPAAFLGGDEPVEVEPPATPGGGDLIEEGTLGAMSLFFGVGEVVDGLDALAVADAWEGDSYVIGEDDGRTCVSWRVELESRRGDRVDEALATWVDGLPDAALDLDADTAEITACDPGPDAAIDVVGRSVDMLAYPVIRTYLQIGLFSAGADPDDDAEALDCFVEVVLGDLEPEEFADGGPDDGRIDDLMVEASDRCT